MALYKLWILLQNKVYKLVECRLVPATLDCGLQSPAWNNSRTVDYKISRLFPKFDWESFYVHFTAL